MARPLAADFNIAVTSSATDLKARPQSPRSSFRANVRNLSSSATRDHMPSRIPCGVPPPPRIEFPICPVFGQNSTTRETSMTVYGGKELAEAFRTVRKNTIQVAEDIPESKYNHVPAPDCRSVGRMLTHIAISTRIWEEVHKKRLTSLADFDFLGAIDRFNAEESKPRTKAEIVALLRSEGGNFAAWLETLTPEVLAETVTEPDGKTSKSRFERLLGAKEHEMHHRGQL